MSHQNNSRESDAKTLRDWHPYDVWQKRIKETENKPSDPDQNPTGSWRTDAVWQNLIKD